MSRNTSVVLGKDHDAFVKTQVRKGRFGSASEAVRAGLTLLEEHENRLERLRIALAEGEASGPLEDFDIESFIGSKRQTG